MQLLLKDIEFIFFYAQITTAMPKPKQKGREFPYFGSVQSFMKYNAKHFPGMDLSDFAKMTKAELNALNVENGYGKHVAAKSKGKAPAPPAPAAPAKQKTPPTEAAPPAKRHRTHHPAPAKSCTVQVKGYTRKKPGCKD